MKKNKGKAKGTGKEAGETGRGQVVKLRPAKPKVSWLSRLPSPTQYWISARDFVKEAIQELRKVTWPDKRETLGTTAVVLLLVLFLSMYLGLVDFGLSRLVSQVAR